MYGSYQSLLDRQAAERRHAPSDGARPGAAAVDDAAPRVQAHDDVEAPAKVRQQRLRLGLRPRRRAPGEAGRAGLVQGAEPAPPVPRRQVAVQIDVAGVAARAAREAVRVGAHQHVDAGLRRERPRVREKVARPAARATGVPDSFPWTPPTTSSRRPAPPKRVTVIGRPRTERPMVKVASSFTSTAAGPEAAALPARSCAATVYWKTPAAAGVQRTRRHSAGARRAQRRGRHGLPRGVGDDEAQLARRRAEPVAHAEAQRHGAPRVAGRRPDGHDRRLGVDAQLRDARGLGVAGGVDGVVPERVHAVEGVIGGRRDLQRAARRAAHLRRRTVVDRRPDRGDARLRVGGAEVHDERRALPAGGRVAGRHGRRHVGRRRCRRGRKKRTGQRRKHGGHQRRPSHRRHPQDDGPGASPPVTGA